MRITDIGVIELYAPKPTARTRMTPAYSTCLIRISTDDGLMGIAEIDTIPSIANAIISAPTRSPLQRGLREILIGKDASDIEARWQDMLEQTSFIGRRGLVMHAISGIDIALWDLKGKAEGKSVSDLLGGRKHGRVPGYVTIYPLGRCPDDARRKLDRAIAAYNLVGIKIAADRFWHEDPALAELLIRTARDHLGQDFPLMVDAITAFDTVEDVNRMLPVLHDCGIHWLEAPLPLDDIDGHALLKGCGLPVGVGDLGLTAPLEWRPFFEVGIVDIAQPDLSHIGGLTGLVKLQAMAARHGCTRIVPHGWNSNLTLAANLHVLASREPLEMAEFSTSNSPLRWAVTREEIRFDEDGYLPVPEAPGLGMRIDWERIEAFRP